MERFEKNVIKSFESVKRDIMSLREDIIRLTQNQEKIAKMVAEGKKKPTSYVASRTGKVYYPKGSGLAKRLNDKVYFETESEAIKKGYKPFRGSKS